MAYWLLKTEPTCYSWEQFTKDRKTVWDGITNNAALLHLRSMKKGDSAFFYHTGDQRSIVGIAEVTREAYPDPKLRDDKLKVVDIKLVAPLPTPVSLDTIKSDPAFAGWDLLRISRLSVVPTPPAMWKRVLQLAKG